MAVMQDRGASILAKLKNKAKASGKPLQLYLQLFCQEEFLRRLSLSAYAEHLILKGGLYLYTLTNFDSRPTVDVDFLLQRYNRSEQEIEKMILSILNTATGNDFITFEAKGFSPIALEREYQGITFQIIGRIKNTRTPFHVDIGVGDVIVPAIEKHAIPVQLEGFEKPQVCTYSLESTIAEKFDAMLQRLELNSRMKDFYDIYYLAVSFDFNSATLQKAICETLKNRGTPYNDGSMSAITLLAEDQDIQIRWRQAVRRMQLPALSFSEVMDTIQMLLAPVFQALVDGIEYTQTWSAEAKEWH